MSATLPKKILVIEDDTSLNRLLIGQLQKLGHEVIGAGSCAEARASVETTTPDLILLDIRLPDCSGFDLLVEMAPLAPVITMTAYGAVDQAVKAVRTGASDYLVKPVDFEALKLAIERAFETARLKRDVAYWQAQAQREVRAVLIGDSPRIAEMRNMIELYASAAPALLIEGESGTGKELVARTIHETSDRAEGRFVPVDCDPEQETAIISELFGHEPGGVPGAETRREGMLEIAERGTVYISDIAEVSQALQSRILRVLETGTFRRLGGAEDLSSTARVILGTSHDLAELVSAGGFRSELYFRVNAYRISVPSLRERGADTIMLARHFLANRSFQRGAEKTLAPETLDALAAYDWPGNVRELRNAIERGVIVSGASPVILPEHVVIGAGPHGPAPEPGEDALVLRFGEEPTLEELRAAYMALLLERHDGNRRSVARILGISERNTYRLLSKLGGPAS